MFSGLYPDDPLSGLAIDQVVGAVEDLIVANTPYLFANDEEKVGLDISNIDGQGNVTAQATL